MKLKYLGDFPLSSVQKTFTPKSIEIHEVEDADGKYLINTFPQLFEVVEDKKIIKEEIKVEAPKVATDKTSKK